MLAEYSRFPLFRTVGIDSSFYGPPTDAVLESYAEQSSAGLSLREQGVAGRSRCTPGPRCRTRPAAGELNPHFLDPAIFLESVYEPYRRTSPITPARSCSSSRRSQSEGRDGVSPANEFAERLDRFFAELPAGGPWAVEIRNPEYLTPAYFAVLREHGVAHVFNSWTRMPSIGEQLALADSVTGPFLICRALLRPGRLYADAVEAFSPYDRIQDPQPALRADLVSPRSALRSRSDCRPT